MDQNRYYPSAAPYPQNQGFRPPPQQNFDTPDMIGSLQRVLSDNVGQYVRIDFLIGTETLISKQGVLYLVGDGYVVLFDDVRNHYVVCDLYAIKFTYFYFPGQRPAEDPPERMPRS